MGQDRMFDNCSTLGEYVDFITGFEDAFEGGVDGWDEGGVKGFEP